MGNKMSMGIKSRKIKRRIIHIDNHIFGLLQKETHRKQQLARGTGRRWYLWQTINEALIAGAKALGWMK